MDHKYLLAVVVLTILGCSVEASIFDWFSGKHPKDNHEDECKSKDVSVVTAEDRAKYHLTLLFYRFHEPTFMPKGPRNTVFVLPERYWVDKHKHLRELYADKDYLERTYGKIEEYVTIKDLGDKVASLDEVLKPGKESTYAKVSINEDKYVHPLIDAFVAAKNVEELLNMAVYVRERLNPYYFVILMSLVLQLRPDTIDIEYPNLVEVMPNNFIPGMVLNEVREQSALAPGKYRTPIEVPALITTGDEDPTQKTWYFREDLGVNVNHLHWHIFWSRRGVKGFPAVDRGGENFFYFHQQTVTRHNWERLSCDLPIYESYTNFNDPIREGHFPKLFSCAGNRAFPGRQPNTPMVDVNRVDNEYTRPKAKLTLWRERIESAIQSGMIITAAGTNVSVMDTKGMDVLGDVIEASASSMNGDYYGNLHFTGHNLISFSHDPTGFYKEDQSDLGDSSMALRDPSFYPWHTFINDLFWQHRDTLPPYTKDELSFNGVEVESFEVTTEGKPAKNTVFTSWEKAEVDVSTGMDFTPRGKNTVIFTHLRHDTFQYNIKVKNSKGAKTAICRIFLAPKYDEAGNALTFNQQKKLAIELDTFFHKLVEGENTITRSSKDASITIPYEELFRKSKAVGAKRKAWLACGWPDYMLIPKGSEKGMTTELFFMISDYENEKVEGNDWKDGIPELERGVTYCGWRDKFPTTRNMGYPFDRRPREGVTTVKDFVTSNAAAIDLTILHTNVTNPVVRKAITC